MRKLQEVEQQLDYFQNEYEQATQKIEQLEQDIYQRDAEKYQNAYVQDDTDMFIQQSEEQPCNQLDMLQIQNEEQMKIIMQKENEE